MLVSLFWLKKFLPEGLEVEQKDLVERIGARLVEVEDVIDEQHKYDNIFVVQVVTAEKIAGTHLTLCKVDDAKKCTSSKIKRDDDGLIQVMCGAPNVRAGMLAAWIAPGAIVPQSVHEDAPFVIGVRKMLGEYDSYGMLASATELDFGDDHDGISELNPEEVKVGDSLTDIFGLDDVILDIENKSLTHRPDTFGLLGFAREVSGIYDHPFKTDEWYYQQDIALDSSENLKLDIEIEDSKLCPRYTALVMEQHGDSLDKYLDMQDTLLSRSGMRPIDPIVDATNLLMLTTGQPLHAFDYDKFIAVGGTKTPKIVVRAARSGEKIELLDGKEVELKPFDIVICSNDTPVALAGAMGGKSTEVDSKTKRIILESATFSLFNLRKTQFAHGIFSEAITRFTKGQPAGQTLPVVIKFAEMMRERFSMKTLGVFDSQKTSPKAKVLQVSSEKINKVLGTNFDIDKIVQTLENVEFNVEVDNKNLTITVPFWREDINIVEDIIEEVGRLNGFDNIPQVLPSRSFASPAKDNLGETKSAIRQILASFGANELLTYSFVNEKLLDNFLQDAKNSYRIVNSISPDLQVVRQSLAPSLLQKSYENLKAGMGRFVLFEMNQVYRKSDGLDGDGVPVARHNLALTSLNKTGESQFYILKKYLNELADRFNVVLEFKQFKPANDASEDFYEKRRSAEIFLGEDRLGVVGEIKASVAKSLKLPLGVATAEVDLKVLLNAKKPRQANFKLSRYPSVERDLTIKIASETPHASIEDAILDGANSDNIATKLTSLGIYQGDDKTTKNVSFRLRFTSQEKTLTRDEIAVIMENVKEKLNKIEGEVI